MIYLENDYLNIKYYENILYLQNDKIEIKMPQSMVSITGKDLEIRYYSEQEIVVCGKIESVKFI
ncbi:YabP/YqfC family sporulation protein [uncultured Thomasclavelia sp.]|uniref:YabP/YqfC family sporulation protein n=1 Tax=uncultured Thomasclavelia sp. TaxID=3025759 RepID=UPI00280BA131|nr:YabP/YqfC family sporulation protein [uncultured Thomasclavelia sp.]